MVGTFYSGTPYLGTQGPLPPGSSTQNECGEFYIIAHNHALYQITSWGVNMTGPITYTRVNPPNGVCSGGRPEMTSRSHVARSVRVSRRAGLGLAAIAALVPVGTAAAAVTEGARLHRIGGAAVTCEFWAESGTLTLPNGTGTRTSP